MLRFSNGASARDSVENQSVPVCVVMGLIITARSPDDAKIKQKMLYASSKESLKAALQGVAIEIQATDRSEAEYDVGMSSYLLALAAFRYLFDANYQTF
jgi:hypothetical protein